MYLFTSYNSVFIDIFNFLSDQIDKHFVMKIPLSGLKKEQIEEFNKSRSDFTNVNYIDSAVEYLIWSKTNSEHLFSQFTFCSLETGVIENIEFQ